MNIKPIITILFFLACLSCQEKKHQPKSNELPKLTALEKDSILKYYHFDYETPIVLEGANQILIPMSTKSAGKRESYGKEGYSTGDYPRFWNVLFYNLKTGKTRLLTNNKMRISQIEAKSNNLEEDLNKIFKDKILYQIGDIDYNKDEKLDDEDPEFLFISETDGTQLIKISPTNEDLQYYEVIPNSKDILIRTLRDGNNDFVFDKDDDSIWYKAAFTNNTWSISEMIDSTQKSNIKNLFFEHWLNESANN